MTSPRSDDATNEDADRRIRSYLEGTITPDEFAALEASLADDAALRERFLREANLTTALEDAAIAEAAPKPEVAPVPPQRSLARLLPWSIAAAALVGLFTLAIWPNSDAVEQPAIAMVTGLDGSLVWTGDRGRVVREIAKGQPLAGGTIEGLTPDSWFELTFVDGSKVVLVGRSTLTFADDGQKRLRLREGTFTADVQPQPSGRPMVIDTRTATYEVVGTAFRLDAGLTASVLNVREGTVQATRRSDGASVPVTAAHRVVAAAGGELVATPIPAVVRSWQSLIASGPDQLSGQRSMYGDWTASTGDAPARLRTIPFTVTPDDDAHRGLDRPLTIYTTALPVSTGDTPPVLLDAGSVVRVAASVATDRTVFVGLTLRDREGNFAGRYQVTLPVNELRRDGHLTGSQLLVALPVDRFTLDPSLASLRDRLPSSLDGLIVETCWCHTLLDPAGLAIESIAIESPSAD